MHASGEPVKTIAEALGVSAVSSRRGIAQSVPITNDEAELLQGSEWAHRNAPIGHEQDVDIGVCVVTQRGRPGAAAGTPRRSDVKVSVKVFGGTTGLHRLDSPAEQSCLLGLPGLAARSPPGPDRGGGRRDPGPEAFALGLQRFAHRHGVGVTTLSQLPLIRAPKAAEQAGHGGSIEPVQHPFSWSRSDRLRTDVVAFPWT